jgi:hypothetical protein
MLNEFSGTSTVRLNQHPLSECHASDVESQLGFMPVLHICDGHLNPTLNDSTASQTSQAVQPQTGFHFSVRLAVAALPTRYSSVRSNAVTIHSWLVELSGEPQYWHFKSNVSEIAPPHTGHWC